MAWLLAQKPWIVPIPGTRKVSRLEENIGACTVTLSATELKNIRAAADAIAVVVDRYPVEFQRMLIN